MVKVKIIQFNFTIKHGIMERLICYVNMLVAAIDSLFSSKTSRNLTVSENFSSTLSISCYFNWQPKKGYSIFVGHTQMVVLRFTCRKCNECHLSGTQGNCFISDREYISLCWFTVSFIRSPAWVTKSDYNKWPDLRNKLLLHESC